MFHCILFFPHRSIRHVYFSDNLACLYKSAVFPSTSLIPTVYLTYFSNLIDSEESVVILSIILKDYQFFNVDISLNVSPLIKSYPCITSTLLYYSFVLQISPSFINCLCIPIIPIYTLLN